jgi:hypothetical protein
MDARREPRVPFAVRADGGAGLDRIAEQVFARNERGWRVIARERPRRAEQEGNRRRQAGEKTIKHDPVNASFSPTSS